MSATIRYEMVLTEHPTAGTSIAGTLARAEKKLGLTGWRCGDK